MNLRLVPNDLHKYIGFYPGSPSFDRLIADDQERLAELYNALTIAGITPTHRVYMPWACGWVDVTDPTVWDDTTGKIRCFWVSPYSIADPAVSWKYPDQIIFDQILE